MARYEPHQQIVITSDNFPKKILAGELKLWKNSSWMICGNRITAKAAIPAKFI
jgi:hypothetical protein